MKYKTVVKIIENRGYQVWCVDNRKSPSPQLKFAVGYWRGKDGDLLCWSKIIDPEHCLSSHKRTLRKAVEDTLNKEMAWLLKQATTKSGLISRYEARQRFEK